MLDWDLHGIGWWLARGIITLGAILTIQHMIHQEGYRVEFQTLLISSIVSIIALRMWMPSCKDK